MKKPKIQVLVFAGTSVTDIKIEASIIQEAIKKENQSEDAWVMVKDSLGRNQVARIVK